MGTQPALVVCERYPPRDVHMEELRADSCSVRYGDISASAACLRKFCDEQCAGDRRLAVACLRRGNYLPSGCGRAAGNYEGNRENNGRRSLIQASAR